MGPEIVASAATGAAFSELARAMHAGNERSERLLEQMLNTLVAMRAYSSRATHRTLYPINLNPGKVFMVDGRMRASHISISGAEAGDLFAFKMGAANLFEWYMGTPDYKEIDLPTALTPGAQISVSNITDGADTAWRCYLWAEQDMNDISG